MQSAQFIFERKYFLYFVNDKKIRYIPSKTIINAKYRIKLIAKSISIATTIAFLIYGSIQRINMN